MIDWGGCDGLRDWVRNGPLSSRYATSRETTTRFTDCRATVHAHRNSLVVLLKLLHGLL